MKEQRTERRGRRAASRHTPAFLHCLAVTPCSRQVSVCVCLSADGVGARDRRPAEVRANGGATRRPDDVLAPALLKSPFHVV